MAIYIGSVAVKLLWVWWRSNVPVKGWAVIVIRVGLWDGLRRSTELLCFIISNHGDDSTIWDIDSVEAEAWWSGDGDPCTSYGAWSWFHKFRNIIVGEIIVNCNTNGETSWAEFRSSDFFRVSWPCEISNLTSASVTTDCGCSKWCGSSNWCRAVNIGLKTNTLGSVYWKNSVWNDDAIIIIEGNSHGEGHWLSFEYWSVGEVRRNIGLVWDTVGYNSQGLTPWAGTAVSWFKNVQEYW